MSNNYIVLIPQNPYYIPTANAQNRAKALLETFLPRAEGIAFQTFEEVTFFDCGSNFAAAICPACGTDTLRDGTWQELMSAAFTTRFDHLLVTMPCCGAMQSLNDLIYEWPVGFARCSFEASNSDSTGITSQQLLTLQQEFGCEIRVTWKHQ